MYINKNVKKKTFEILRCEITFLMDLYAQISHFYIFNLVPTLRLIY